MSDRAYLVAGGLATAATMAGFVLCAAYEVSPNWFGAVGMVHTILVFVMVFMAWEYAEDKGRSPAWWGLWTFVLPPVVLLVLALLPTGEVDSDVEDWRPRLVGLSAVAALGLLALSSGPLDGPSRLPAVGLVVLVLSAFTAVHACGQGADEVFDSGVGWALAGFLMPFVVPLVLAVVLTLTRDDGDGGAIRAIEVGRRWRCPGCGTILEKKNVDLVSVLGNANIVGTVTCGVCRAQYGHRDVYSGRYDV